MSFVLFRTGSAKLKASRAQGRLNGQPAVLRGLVAPEVVSYLISGVTRDSAGAPLGNCTVDLFSWPAKTLYGSVVSSGSGVYVLSVGPGQLFRAVSYNANDTIAGSTAGTLSGA